MKSQRSSNNAFAGKVCVLIAIVMIGYISKPPTNQAVQQGAVGPSSNAKIIPVQQNLADTTTGRQVVATNPLVKPVSFTLAPK